MASSEDDMFFRLRMRLIVALADKDQVGINLKFHDGRLEPLRDDRRSYFHDSDTDTEGMPRLYAGVRAK